MTRYNIFRILIGSGVILAAIGCGDAGQAATDIAETDVGEDPRATADLETELALACESVCDKMRDCGREPVGSECADSCFTSYPTDLGEECILAKIDLLNCSSGSNCTVSLTDFECGEAVLRARTSCPGKGDVGEIIVVSDRELIEEVTEDVPSDSDDAEDETDDETEGDPIEVPDFTDGVVIPEIPTEIDPIDLPWIPVFDER